MDVATRQNLAQAMANHDAALAASRAATGALAEWSIADEEREAFLKVSGRRYDDGSIHLTPIEAWDYRVLNERYEKALADLRTAGLRLRDILERLEGRL